MRGPLNSLGRFEGLVLLIIMVCLVAGGVGAVFGFIGFSEGDRFAAKFSALVTADTNLQTGLTNEKTMRTAADMALMNQQAALQARKKVHRFKNSYFFFSGGH